MIILFTHFQGLHQRSLSMKNQKSPKIFQQKSLLRCIMGRFWSSQRSSRKKKKDFYARYAFQEKLTQFYLNAATLSHATHVHVP